MTRTHQDTWLRIGKPSVLHMCTHVLKTQTQFCTCHCMHMAAIRTATARPPPYGSDVVCARARVQVRVHARVGVQSSMCVYVSVSMSVFVSAWHCQASVAVSWTQWDHMQALYHACVPARCLGGTHVKQSPCVALLHVFHLMLLSHSTTYVYQTAHSHYALDRALRMFTATNLWMHMLKRQMHTLAHARS